MTDATTTDGQAREDGLTSQLSSRRVFLRPVSPNDYDWIYAVATGPETFLSWRLRGVAQAPEGFARALWQDVLVQFMACGTDSTRLGLVQIYGANARNRYAYLSALYEPDTLRKGWPLEALVLLVNHAFNNFDLHKIYVEALTDSRSSFESAIGTLLVEEGVLREHEFLAGKRRDYHILALYRDTWFESPLSR